MENNHGFQIEKLKNSFNNILQIIEEIMSVKFTANNTLQKLKDAYNKLIQQNNQKVILFCLDSFYFQYKSFHLELENLEKVFLFINNRMYCDYFKLYTMIIEALKDSKIQFTEELELRSYVPYKDLEPFKEYKLEDIKEIHNNILHIIQLLFQNYKNKHDSINNYYQDHEIGFSISNFINTLEYENRILNHQTDLYINYIAFFHISQKKYLKRCFQRFQNFYKEVEDNIHTNQSFSIDDIHYDPTSITSNNESSKVEKTEQKQDVNDIDNMIDGIVDKNKIIVNTTNPHNNTPINTPNTSSTSESIDEHDNDAFNIQFGNFDKK
jgi:hypothetical protein